jgi:hypothetical protein
MGSSLKVPIKWWRLLCRFVLVVQLLSALVHIHKRGFVHTRLLPSIILVLGSAFSSLFAIKGCALPSGFPDATAWGTFQYCAPPQFLGSTTLDIWAVEAIVEVTFLGYLRGGSIMEVYQGLVCRVCYRQSQFRRQLMNSEPSNSQHRQFSPCLKCSGNQPAVFIGIYCAGSCWLCRCYRPWRNSTSVELCIPAC